MLEILIDVASFCDRNRIVYFLSYGTLLGAIRHQGFIPWDDDIDIQMPRPDYERFLSLYKREGKYSVFNPREDNGIWLWTKVYNGKTIKNEACVDYSKSPVLGLDIDVFPLDGQPDSEHSVAFTKDLGRLKRIFKCIQACYRPYDHLPLKSRLFTFACRMRGGEYFKYRFYLISTKYSYSSSEMVGCCSIPGLYKNRHQKSLFESTVPVSFEGHLFSAPVGYDRVLRDLYGDYMQLPPEKDRQAHHFNKVYWK